MALDFASSTEIQAAWKYLDGNVPAPKSAYEAHEVIEGGLPAAMLRHFRDKVRALSDKTWAQIVDVSLSQVKELRKKSKLSVRVSSQLVLFAVLLARAEDVFGGREEALRWFDGEQMALSGRRPIDLLDTFVGANLVARTLTQIDRGVYI
ncbi:MAG: antitoxin Xre/MbcA/ParS toxin-binding domain-containing protein [Pseudomonadota bacterium]